MPSADQKCVEFSKEGNMENRRFNEVLYLFLDFVIVNLY